MCRRRIPVALGGEFDTALGEPYLSRATLLATSAHLSRQRFGGLAPVLSAAGFVNEVFLGGRFVAEPTRKTVDDLG